MVKDKLLCYTILATILANCQSRERLCDHFKYEDTFAIQEVKMVLILLYLTDM